MSTRDLARALNPTGRPPLRRRAGVVANVGAGTVDVQVAGDTTTTLTGLAYLNSYAPAVGDLVWLLLDGPDWIVLGMTADPAFVTYAPTITASTTNPTMTTGGRYRLLPGRFVQGVGRITTVTALGTGTYSISLPLATATGYAVDDPLGMMHFRSNAGVHVIGEVAWATTTTATVLIASPGGTTPNLSRWTNAAPAGQIAGDTWSWDYHYQAA